MTQTGYDFFLGWSFVLLLFWLGSKFEGSRTIIYYIAWLTVALMVAVRYKDINTIFASIGLEPDSVTGGGSKLAIPSIAQ